MPVIAYHLIWTAYGTWLPNDPRGSGSKQVHNRVLSDLGEVHYGRRKVQPSRANVRAFYTTAEHLLKFDVIRFDERQRSQVGECFAQIMHRHRYTCYACAIMPDHVHLVIRKHRDQAEDMIERIQEESREALNNRCAVPESHPVWTHGGWKVFLHTPSEVWSRIHYIERNPSKEQLPKQTWRFVVPYDNWPFHKAIPR